MNLLSLAKNIHPSVGFFRFKKLNGKILITNDIGGWHFLDEDEFASYVQGKLEDGPLYEALKNKLFIKGPDYETQMAAVYRKKNSFLFFGPTLHMIVTTLRCNHACKYCHAAVAPMTAKDLDMTVETAEKVVDTIFYSSSPNLTIEFQGGESLVNWKVVQFVIGYAKQKAYFLKKNLTFSLVTNLSLMDDEKLTYLLDEGINICTSLDGDTETHNDQRVWKDGNSYEKATYWIKKIENEMKKRGDESYKVGALTTWTKTSIKNYKKIIDAYASLGINTIGFRWLNPYGFAAAQKADMSYSLEEYKAFYRNGMDYILDLNKKGVYLREMISSVYLQSILTNEGTQFMDIRSPSGVALGGVAYNYDGKVYASDESRMLGRMGKQDFLLTPMLETGEATYTAMANSDVTKIATLASTLDGLPGYNDSVYKPYMGTDIIYSYTQYGNPYSTFAKDEKNKMHLVTLDYLFEKLQDPESAKIFKSWVFGEDFLKSEA